MQIDDALALEAKHFARLRAGRNAQLDLAFQRRHIDFGAQRGLRKTDRHLDDDVVLLAHEQRMLLDVNDDVQIAGRSAREAGFALAAQFEARAVVDARGNPHRERFLFADAPLPLTFRARVGDDRAFATAISAGGGDRKETLLGADLAGSATIGAGADAGRAALGTASVAFVALG